MPIGDIIFLAIIAIAVGSVALLSMRSKRQRHADVPAMSPDQNADTGQ